jgi:NADPH:quinone reductase-like Zn-dependent oxidoreductase
MRAVYAQSLDPDNPLAGLVVGERPAPAAPEGWTRVAVRAASLNHHDLWTLRGVGIKAEQLPMILGCDAAGIDEATGQEVVVHAVINAPGWEGDDTLDPRRSLLSERHQGSLAEYVIVPRRNVVPKPAELSWAEAACLSTAWLTAYRMLFTQSGLRAGQTVLVQGASGGVATACIALARAAGLRVLATARTAAKQAMAVKLGAHESF